MIQMNAVSEGLRPNIGSLLPKALMDFLHSPNSTSSKRKTLRIFVILLKLNRDHSKLLKKHVEQKFNTKSSTIVIGPLREGMESNNDEKATVM